jgi:excinuclease ABC subunit C
VVHVPQRGDFGPYLGGRKARDAVSGLLRVLPLCYAAESAGATSRDMARLRGVVPADRARLAAALRAVLDRDAAAVAAVRTGLEHRRDTASAALEFEFAARLHGEIEALDWITARQDVTLGEPADFDVHGWADGVLVRFEMRHGRLSGWRQRACREAAATPLVAATPPEWTAFASRNATLAAQLLTGGRKNR